MFIKQALAVDLETLYAPGAALGGKSATLSNLLNPIIANVLVISGVAAFFTIFFAGFTYITAGGDKTKTEQAQQMLNYGILGLIVIVVAYLITKLVGLQLGFSFF